MALLNGFKLIWCPIYQGMADAGVEIGSCIFEPSCSEYAIQALKKYPLSQAVRAA
ncbi:MAG: membrane protein insertion efficiency factor YidD [bacterium]